MKNQDKFIMLVSIFSSTLVISNVLATKLWVVPYFNVVMPAGVIAYPITFLMTDVIGEVWGKQAALRVVKAGFVCALISLILGLLAVALPPAKYFSAESQDFFSVMFSGVGRITFASLAAYLVSQLNDTYLFHRLRELTGGKHLWLRNNASTIISQFFDTIIFITIAFYGIMPNNVLLELMIGQWGVKIFLALLDTPFCYWLVAWCYKEVAQDKKAARTGCPDNS